MTLYESAFRSKLAYLDPEEVKKCVPDAEFITSKDDAQVYFWKIDDTVYVTFRGTSSIKDATVDLNLSRIRIKDKIKVHEGFYTQFKSVEIEITKRLVREHTAKRIVFAGHSLGGALAQIAAAYYGEIFDYSCVVCHTFGSPRVGNKYFVEWFSKHVDENVRVMNRNDPVPMMPTFHYWVHTTNTCLVLYEDGRKVSQPDDIPWYKRLYRLVSSGKLDDHDCDLYVRRTACSKTTQV
jgi:predicted lipase